MMPTTSYAIALGSNRRHGSHGSPAETVRAAIDAVAQLGRLQGASTVLSTPALGPAGRRFANAMLLLSTALDPDELLAELKRIEREFGRKRGRRWGPRVLDLDIILWSEGFWSSRGLTVPHPGMSLRRFVLEPLAQIAAEWRDPVSGARVRHLVHRLRRAAPVDPDPARS